MSISRLIIICKGTLERWLKVLSRREVATAIIIVLVGLSSYGLGRLSKVAENTTSIGVYGLEIVSKNLTLSADNVIDNVQTSASTAVVANVVSSDVVSSSGVVVASKNGTKYHFPWCSGAKRISEKNLITFNSATDARASGYTPASNCKGLE